MRLPFGLDLKTVIVTLVLAFVVWPFVTNMLSSRKKAE
jgi:hypothetical protein